MKENLIVGAIVATTIAVSLASCGSCAGNITGESRSQATKAARQWAMEVGLNVQGVTCANSDTDGDGYVSCTVSAKNADGDINVHSIECAAAFTLNSGCRAPKLTNPQRR